MVECMEKIRDSSLPHDERLIACDELELLVEDLDNANGFIYFSNIVKNICRFCKTAFTFSFAFLFEIFRG